METMMYKAFVTLDERTDVSQLAELLEVDIDIGNQHLIINMILYSSQSLL